MFSFCDCSIGLNGGKEDVPDPPNAMPISSNLAFAVGDGPVGELNVRIDG